MNTNTQRAVFVPVYAERDKEEIRRELLCQKIYPIFWDEKYPYQDLVDFENLSVRDFRLYDLACLAIEEFAGMVVPEAFASYDSVKQLINHCDRLKLPVHLVKQDYSLISPWANGSIR